MMLGKDWRELRGLLIVGLEHSYEGAHAVVQL